MDNSEEAQVYKEQVNALLVLLSQSHTPQSGLKQSAMSILGTINHKIRLFYERKMYIYRLVGSYSSTRSLRSILPNNNIEEIYHEIHVSDQKNKNSDAGISITLKKVLLGALFFVYRMIFFLLKKVAKLTFRLVRML